MFVSDMEFSVQDFMELFKKKFLNFCSKSPCLLSFQINGSDLILKEQGSNTVKTFKLDFSKTEKENICIIKEWLIENVYPILIQEKKEFSAYSPIELEKIISETGIKTEDAIFLKKETITRTKWKILKIIVKKDELFLQNLNTGKQYRYKLCMPSTLFLKKLRETYTPTHAWEVFSQKSKMLNEIFNLQEVEEGKVI